MGIIPVVNLLTKESCSEKVCLREPVFLSIKKVNTISITKNAIINGSG